MVNYYDDYTKLPNHFYNEENLCEEMFNAKKTWFANSDGSTSYDFVYQDCLDDVKSQNINDEENLLENIKNEEKKHTITAKTLYQEGDVLLKEINNSDWEIIPNEFELFDKFNEIKVNEKSKAVIEINNSIIRIDENTELTISSDLYYSVAVTLKKGIVYFRISENDKNEYFIKINLPNNQTHYISSILDSAFWVNYNSQNLLEIGVINDKIIYDQGVSDNESLFDQIENQKNVFQNNKLIYDFHNVQTLAITEKDFNDFLKWNIAKDIEFNFPVNDRIKELYK